VTTENYVCSFDVSRRHAVDMVHANEGIAPSVEFMSSLTGIAAATYRKRISRSAERLELDVMEGSSGEFRSFGARRQILEDLVQAGLTWVAAEASKPSQESDLRIAATFVGLRVLGDETAIAGRVAGAGEVSSGRLDDFLESVLMRRGVRAKCAQQVSRQVFLEAMHAPGILEGLEVSLPSGIELDHLLDGIVAFGGVLHLRSWRAALALTGWRGTLDAAGLALVIHLKSSGRSAIDSMRQAELTKSGFDVTIGGERFSRGVGATIRVVKGKVEIAAKRRHVNQAGFLLQAALVAAAFISTLRKEVSHEQKAAG
jgi:hypothetical protein